MSAYRHGSSKNNGKTDGPRECCQMKKQVGISFPCGSNGD